MTTEEKATILEGAKAAFFQAMIDGYVGGENRRSIVETSSDGCAKTVTFVDGDYTVVDKWDVYPDSDKSDGSTRILFCGKPIWRVFYGGHYPEQVIPFLKEALKWTYTRSVFLGGRGPAVFSGDAGMLYINEWSGDFNDFGGFERISSDDTGTVVRLGFHRYFGMSLL